jgi:hypothetical protein
MQNRIVKYVIVIALLLAGSWLVARRAAPAPETSARLAALGALAPGRPLGGQTSAAPVPESGEADFVAVDLSTLPVGADADNGMYARWLRGEVDVKENEGILPEAEIEALREQSLRLPPSAAVQPAQTAPSDAPALGAPAIGVGFQSIDYTNSGGYVPPDPQMAAGPNHLIAVVNTSFAIYNKTGNVLRAPTDFLTLVGGNTNCDGFLFDPNVVYDESANRFILAIDADGDYYCMAVSASADPLGTWRVYAIPTAPGADFFDYPHAGIGRDFLFMGANLFTGNAFKEARIWAIDKADIYAGQTASYASKPLPVSEDTPQPLHLHGWNQGTWPADANHYFFTDTNYNGATYSVWRWTNPLGGSNPTRVGQVNLQNYTNVTAGYPVDAPQSGSAARIQANDYRPHDFEYRDGFAWTTQTIACNPGGGTVNCLRWAKINPATATIVDAGVFASSGQHRIFGDLAVNACGDMAIGYTKTSGSMYPSVFATGRRAGDPAGTLQAEVSIRAGAITYTAFDGSPHRWGDYTGMTIDPDGERFWYIGQYSKNTGTVNGRWGTYVAALSYGECQGGGGGDNPSVELSAKAGGTIGGVAFAAADIVAYDGASGNWSMRLDGSDVGLTKNLNAFYRQDRTNAPDIYYLSFAANQPIAGLGTVAPHDVVKFTPTQLGGTTAGTFELYFDGSDVGLTTTGEKIDALGMDGNGRLLISLTGGGSVPKTGGGTQKTADEDILLFNHTATGPNTAGTWQLFFDGSAAISGLASEDINGLSLDPATGDLYVTLVGGYNVGGVSGNANDILKLSPSGGGNYTAIMVWNGEAVSYGFAIDAIEMAAE